MWTQDTRVVSHRNVVKVDVVAILLNAVIIMTLEDVIPCVVAVTAWWEKGFEVRSDWHAIDDPLTDLVVPNSFVTNFGSKRWQLFA